MHFLEYLFTENFLWKTKGNGFSKTQNFKISALQIPCVYACKISHYTPGDQIWPESVIMYIKQGYKNRTVLLFIVFQIKIVITCSLHWFVFFCRSDGYATNRLEQVFNI